MMSGFKTRRKHHICQEAVVIHQALQGFNDQRVQSVWAGVLEFGVALHESATYFKPFCRLEKKNKDSMFN
jgi:hypothetical protein